MLILIIIEWGSQRHYSLINVQNHVILFERLFFYHPFTPNYRLLVKQPPKTHSANCLLADRFPYPLP